MLLHLQNYNKVVWDGETAVAPGTTRELGSTFRLSTRINSSKFCSAGKREKNTDPNGSVQRKDTVVLRSGNASGLSGEARAWMAAVMRLQRFFRLEGKRLPLERVETARRLNPPGWFFTFYQLITFFF